jgi:hypothetical protein
MKNYAEMLVAAGILGLATAVATGSLQVPLAAASSPYATVILVIAAMGSFSVFPAAGLALFVLTAVLFFKRNLHRTLSSIYGENSIRNEAVNDAAPYESQKSGPRAYDEFNETAPNNPMIGPLQEGFEPSPYGAEAGAPVEGQFPKEKERPEATLKPVEYAYRPASDTGSNEFVRDGPNIDEKANAFAYKA